MELQVYKNTEFGSVRTTTIGRQPYFVGKDVATILGYANTRKALIDHIDEKDKDDITIRDEPNDDCYQQIQSLQSNPLKQNA